MAYPTLRFAAIGLDHDHIFGQVAGLTAAGGECVGYWSDGDGPLVRRFAERFPEVPAADDPARLLEDPTVHLITGAAVPAWRAEIAVAAMEHGKDVLVDKPGVITEAGLQAVRDAQASTGRIFAINFNERFDSRAVTRADELIAAGAIGRVVQTLGTGPHRLKAAGRPGWFFDPAEAGGILADIGTHQIDQFLHLTRSIDAKVVASAVGNHANPEHSAFEDFGEVLLHSDEASGYGRVDWYTPNGLTAWADGRLTILGTAGYMELRKYADIAGRPGGDHLFLVDGRETRYLDCRDTRLPFYDRLRADVFERGEAAMVQDHCFKVCELALAAQARAVRRGHLAGAGPVR